MMKSIEFNHVRITPYIQYIYRAGTLWSGEVLSRVIKENGDIDLPLEFFNTLAQRRNAQTEFDFKLIDMVLSLFDQLTLPRLSFNLCPVTLSSGVVYTEFMALTRKYAVDRSRIIIEITEKGSFPDSVRAAEELCRLKQAGFRIAIDDFGCQNSNLDRLSFLFDSVDYIKINEIVHRSPLFAASIIRMLNQLPHITLIAENIESRDVVEELYQMQIIYHQGFYYHRPAPLFSAQGTLKR